MNELKKELLALIPKPLPIIDGLNNVLKSQQLETGSETFIQYFQSDRLLEFFFLFYLRK